MSGNEITRLVERNVDEIEVDTIPPFLASIAHEHGFTTELFSLSVEGIKFLRLNNILWKDEDMAIRFAQKLVEAEIPLGQYFIPSLAEYNINMAILSPCHEGQIFPELVTLIIDHGLDPKVLTLESAQKEVAVFQNFRKPEFESLQPSISYHYRIKETDLEKHIGNIKDKGLDAHIRLAENLYFLINLERFLLNDFSKELFSLLKDGKINNERFSKYAVEAYKLSTEDIFKEHSGYLTIDAFVDNYRSKAYSKFYTYLPKNLYGLTTELIEIDAEEIIQTLKEGEFKEWLQENYTSVRMLLDLAKSGNATAIELFRDTQALDNALNFSDTYPEAFNYLITSLERGSEKAQAQARAVLFSEPEKMPIFGNAFNSHIIAIATKAEPRDEPETYEKVQGLLLELKEARQDQDRIKKEDPRQQGWVGKVFGFGKKAAKEMPAEELKSLDELMADGDKIVADITEKIRATLSEARENRALSKKTIEDALKEAGISDDRIAIADAAGSPDFLAKLLLDGPKKSRIEAGAGSTERTI